MAAAPWLEPLLRTEFFSACRVHGHSPRSECNLYCLDCNGGGAFCPYCRSAWHKDHQVVQIRRLSYHSAVRVGEIKKAVDVSGVQTYVINGSRVIFLNERPQHKTPPSGVKPVGTAAHTCEICRRSLLDPLRFCSLGCKLGGMKRNGDPPCINLEATDKTPSIEEEMHESSKEDYNSSLHAPSSKVHHRRKGIPRRAPLGFMTML